MPQLSIVGYEPLTPDVPAGRSPLPQFDPTPEEARMLAEIRARESSGNYSARNPKPGSTATGAYQFIGPTWQLASAETGVPIYPSAAEAPPAVQDANALHMLRKYGPNADITWAASGPYKQPGGQPASGDVLSRIATGNVTPDELGQFLQPQQTAPVTPKAPPATPPAVTITHFEPYQAPSSITDQLKSEGFLDSAWNAIKGTFSMIRDVYSGQFLHQTAEQIKQFHELEKSGTPEQKREFAKRVVLGNIPLASTTYKATHGNIPGAAGDVVGMAALPIAAEVLPATVSAVKTGAGVASDVARSPLAADVVGMASPRTANAMRVYGRSVKGVESIVEIIREALKARQAAPGAPTAPTAPSGPGPTTVESITSGQAYAASQGIDWQSLSHNERLLMEQVAQAQRNFAEQQTKLVTQPTPAEQTTITQPPAARAEAAGAVPEATLEYTTSGAPAAAAPPSAAPSTFQQFRQSFRDRFNQLRDYFARTPEAAAPATLEAQPEAGTRPPGPPGPVMSRAERRATAMPPETGVPEAVARAMAEREAIIGKPREQWTNADVLAADALRAEGYTGAGSMRTGQEPALAPQPAAAAPAQPTAVITDADIEAWIDRGVQDETIFRDPTGAPRWQRTGNPISRDLISHSIETARKYPAAAPETPPTPPAGKPQAPEIAAQLEASTRVERLTDYLVRKKIPGSWVENFGDKEWQMVADDANPIPGGAPPPSLEDIAAIRRNIAEYEGATKINGKTPPAASAEFQQKRAIQTRRKPPATATEAAPPGELESQLAESLATLKAGKRPAASIAAEGPRAPTASETRVEGLAQHLAADTGVDLANLEKMAENPKSLAQLEELGRALKIKGAPTAEEIPQIVERVKQLRSEASPATPEAPQNLRTLMEGGKAPKRTRRRRTPPER